MDSVCLATSEYRVFNSAWNFMWGTSFFLIISSKSSSFGKKRTNATKKPIKISNASQIQLENGFSTVL